MKHGMVSALALASVSFFALPASAQVVDGVGSPGEYAGGTSAVVGTNAAAPISNFGSPTNEALAGYTINLKDVSGSLYGLLTQSGGEAAGSFANLYFDLNPSVQDGSDLGFELGVNSATAFIPGRNGSKVLDSSLFSTAAGNGTFEFRLANSLFTSAIPGLNYYSGQTFESPIVLRLSQSFNYSVAGGESYGATRLGSVAIVNGAGAVPEPATWAMLIAGFGMVGFALRRSHKVKTAVSYAA